MNTGARIRTERRLAAIVAADIAGYSRLIGADEEPARDWLSSTPAEGLCVNRSAFCSAAHEHK